ncbi:hypothetical protein ABZ840_32705 [Streptomyces sp. NPDC047117]|uniref:hypothetical protein n=1 Tax=Streptomyces sp. NPDC047117 TaxID=3155379 RepID=UPI0033D8A822
MARQRPPSVFSPRSPVVVMAMTFLGGYLETEFGKSWGISGLIWAVTGGLGIAYVAWCWGGRTRSARAWAVIDRGPALALVGVPAFAFPFFGAGLCVFFGLPKVLIIPFGLVTLFCLLMMFIGVADPPKWWGPRWFRQGEHKEDFKGAASRGALGTLADSSAARTPVLSSQEECGKSFGDVAAPVVRWKGGWVHDPDTDEQDHGLARKGTVEGTLAWYPQGLGFAATEREDALRGKPTVVTIPAERLTGVEVAPARAGADGRPRRGRWMRSPFPRLVVRTASDTYVFDVARGRARQVAAFIKERAGQAA